MNAIFVCFILIFITVIGYSVIACFNLLEKESFLAKISLGYGLGVGLVALQLFFYSRFFIPWQTDSLLIPWLLFILIILLIKRNEIKKIHFVKPGFPKLKTLEKILLLAILITISYTIFEALLRPVSTWDAWATWLLRSKVFFIDQGIHVSSLNYVLSNYPLVYSLLGTYIYIFLGHVDDTAVLLTSTAYYLFLGLLFFAFLRKKCNFTYSLLFTFLLLSTQNFIRHGGRIETGLADLPVGYYTFSSLLLFIDYIKKPKIRIFILCNIFLGILTLVKSEGIFITLTVSLLALYFIFKNKLFNHLFVFLFWLLPFGDWTLYQHISHMKLDYPGHEFAPALQKVPYAIVGTIKELVTIKSWNLLWISYFLSLFFVKYSKNKELLVINTICLSQLFIYVSIYIFYKGYSPESSIERLLIHIAPLAFYAVAIVVWDFYASKKSLKSVFFGNFLNRILS